MKERRPTKQAAPRSKFISCKDSNEEAILRAYRLLKDDSQAHIVRFMAAMVEPDSRLLRHTRPALKLVK